MAAEQDPSREFCERIARLNTELGVPADYAATRGFSLQPEANETTLVAIATTNDGRAIRLLPPVAAAWFSMHDAARLAGLSLMPLSGFRSVARQTEIIRGKLNAGERIADILRFVAAPGYSEHHTGGAVDIGAPGETALTESFAHTPAFNWLDVHAPGYGFHLSYRIDNPHGIGFEPWHWCWHRLPAR